MECKRSGVVWGPEFRDRHGDMRANIDIPSDLRRSFKRKLNVDVSL